MSSSAAPALHAAPPAAVPVANARMYSVNLAVREDWKALLRWVLDRAGLDWPVIDHDAPAPLNALWARGDLGLALMCGLPFARRAPAAQLLAAPVPAPARFQGRPRYCSDIVVLADAPYQRLADTFGGVAGYTLADSLSGGVAWRAHLAPHHRAQGGRLYRAAVGGLIHARGVIEALADGRIDVGPLDGWYHELLRRHEPALAAQVRVIDHTAWQPIPPLVATAALPEATRQRLREALFAAGEAAELQVLRDRLLLRGFADVAAADYQPLAALSLADVPDFEQI